MQILNRNCWLRISGPEKQREKVDSSKEVNPQTGEDVNKFIRVDIVVSKGPKWVSVVS